MLTNSFTIKGKTRVLLSQCKTVLFELLNIKKRITLHRIWSKISPEKKKFAIVIADGPSFNKDIAKQIVSKRKFFDIVVMNNYCLNFLLFIFFVYLFCLFVFIILAFAFVFISYFCSSFSLDYYYYLVYFL